MIPRSTRSQEQRDAPRRSSVRRPDTRSPRCRSGPVPRCALPSTLRSLASPRDSEPTGIARASSVPGDFARSGHAAEAGVAGRGVGRERVARRHAVAPAVRVRGRGTSRRAWSGACPRGGPCGLVRLSRVWKSGLIPVRAPLPDVAGHVVEAVAVRREGVHRARAVEAVGERVLARERRPARRSSGARRRARARRPRGTAWPSSPPRAAYSHSASVGRRLPAQRAVGLGVVPAHVDDRVVHALLEVGAAAPSGRRQSAPSTWRHHGACAAARVGGKSSGSRPAKTNDQPKRSASVTWPVASTKRANSAFETAHGVDPERVEPNAAHRPLAVARVRERAGARPSGTRRREGRPCRHSRAQHATARRAAQARLSRAARAPRRGPDSRRRARTRPRWSHARCAGPTSSSAPVLYGRRRGGSGRRGPRPWRR